MKIKKLLASLSFWTFSALWTGFVINVFFIDPISLASAGPAFYVADHELSLFILGIAALLSLHLPWVIMKMSRKIMGWRAFLTIQFRSLVTVIGYFNSLLLLMVGHSVIGATPDDSTSLLVICTFTLTMLISGLSAKKYIQNTEE